MRHAIAALALLAAAAPATAAPATTPGAVAVSGESPFPDGCGLGGDPYVGAEVEPSVAVDPSDPSRIVGVWQQDRFSSHGGALSNVVGASKDGGATWTRALVPGISRCTGGRFERATDPWVSTGPDGMTYLATLAFDGDTSGPSAILVSTSTDGGLSWNEPATVAEDVAVIFNDKQAITADPRRPGHAYLAWSRFVEAPLNFVSRTIDGGRTWSPAISMGSAGIGDEILVLPDGTLLSVYSVYAGIMAQRSLDGGLTWLPPVVVDATGFSDVYEPESGARVRSGDFLPTSDVAPDGTVYVAQQSRDGVRFSLSSTGGLTWSPALPAARAPNAFTPTLAVAGDGTVGVSFYDFRNDRRGDGVATTDVWFVHSHDRGATWTESHVAGPFDMLTAPDADGLFLGDYQGLAGLPSGFGALFAQARPQATAGATDIFFAHVRA